MHQASPVRGCARVDDPVQDGVAQVDVRRGHVDLRPQDARAVRELARAHAREQVEVLLDATGPGTASSCPARSACRGSRGSRRRSGRRRTRCPCSIEVDGPVVQLLEVVGRVVEVARPSRSPSQRTSASIASMYSCSSFSGFVSSNRRLQRPPNSLRDAEVEADRLRVADVEVAVGLGREAGDGDRDPARGDVGGDDLADEVAALDDVRSGG